MRKIFLFVLLFTPCARAADSVCKAWLEKAKVSTKDKECITKCSTLKVDMNTFVCPDHCDELCKGNESCLAVDEYLRGKLGATKPKNWLAKKEKTKDWNTSEANRLRLALRKIPRFLFRSELQFIRFEKSQFKDNPASSVVGLGTIAIYDSAFTSKIPLERSLAHEFAHFYYDQLDADTRDSYRTAAGWVTNYFGKNGDFVKVGPSVEEDGNLDPDEDFANNLEYMLFEPAKLQKVSPRAYGWLKNRFESKMSMRGICE